MISHPSIKEEMIRRIMLWHKGSPQPPVRLHFQPTDNCNLHCVFCKGSFGHPPERMRDSIPRELALGLVKESAELGVCLWSISGGGEPTCVPYWPDLLKAIKENAMYGEMNTNATLFTDTTISEIVRMGWDHLIVSLDGADAATHDMLRGQRGSFCRTTKAITRFTHYKRQYKAENPLVGLAVVLCRRNASQLEKMIVLAHELGCGNVSFNPVKQPSSECQSSRVKDLELDGPAIALVKQQVLSALDLAESLGVETTLGQLSSDILKMKNDMRPLLLCARDKPSPLSQPCYEPWYNLTVDSKGDVGHCCESHRGHTLANIRSTRLADAWFTQMKPIRNLLAQCQLPEYCARCGAWQLSRTADIRRLLNEGNI